MQVYIVSSKETDTRTRILEATRRLIEERQDPNIRMRDIAKAAGISRQALYLHFASRSELMIETTHYVDEIKGLGERLRAFESASSGGELLDIYVETWGRYIPEIYGIGKVLLRASETDEAAAAAWSDRMRFLRMGCGRIVKTLHSEGKLAPGWGLEEAEEMLWTNLSVRNWEQLTIDCGWSVDRYIHWMQHMLRSAFVREEGSGGVRGG